MKYHEAEIIEDNGGGLHLFVFGRGGINGGRVIYAADGFEHNPGALTECCGSLIDGDDTRTWEGCESDPQATYDELTAFEYGWEVVAKVHSRKLHKFPSKMGAAARIEFGE